MVRLTFLALASLLSLTACAADAAAQDAREQVDRVAELLKGVDPWVSEDVGHRLTQDGNLAVFDVSGDGPDDPGRVRIRVRGTDRAFHPPAPGVSSPAAVAFLCFDVEVIYRSKLDRSRAGIRDRRVTVTEVACPEGRPRSFRPPAELPDRTSTWLKKHLPTTLDVDAARQAVRGLDLDPRIRQDITEFDDKIGIALREPDGDCLLARVWPNVVQVWRPWTWTPPVLPAERVCSAAQAASGYSNRAR
ncbi:hypothetical protein GCM10012289_69980 [Nonomuraea cavernae]|uniref:Uncharacterized protein n=1 Tax=Nonomuraea cavernae TaxID=2045107 RepID=A0A917ZEF7_9ACTN|nr:hypothetical protein GCM10012289_69980 [Nonomuraea cavernae]